MPVDLYSVATSTGLANNGTYSPVGSDFNTQYAQQYMNPYLQTALNPQLDSEEETLKQQKAGLEPQRPPRGRSRPLPPFHPGKGKTAPCHSGDQTRPRYPRELPYRHHARFGYGGL